VKPMSARRTSACKILAAKIFDKIMTHLLNTKRRSF
jgi:hypothetical protein